MKTLIHREINMDYLTNGMITENTKKHLENHGLTLEIKQNSDCKSPRGFSTTSFVGAEIEVPRGVSLGHNSADLVENYCRVVLKCKPDDIIWALVHHTNNKDEEYQYSLAPYAKDSTVAGFIFITKDELRAENEGVKRIGLHLRDSTIERFKKELRQYSEYMNGRSYTVSVESEQDKHVASRTNIQHVDGDINAMASALIESVVRWDKRLYRAVEVEIGTHHHQRAQSTTAEIYFLDRFEVAHGFKPLLESSSTNKDTSRVTAKIALIEFSPLGLLPAAQKEAFHAKIKDHAERLVAEDSAHEVFTPEDEAALNAERTVHSSWSPLLLEALVMAAMVSAQGITFIGAKLQE